MARHRHAWRFQTRIDTGMRHSRHTPVAGTLEWNEITEWLEEQTKDFDGAREWLAVRRAIQTTETRRALLTYSASHQHRKLGPDRMCLWTAAARSLGTRLQQ